MVEQSSLRAVTLLVFLPWTASAQDAYAAIVSAGKAMGVSDLTTLGSFMYSGSGASFQFGEARTPNLPWPKVNVSSYRRVIDFYAGGSLEIIAHLPSSSASLETTQPVLQEEPEIRRIPFVEPYGRHGKQYDIWITPLGFLKGAAGSREAVVKPIVAAGKPYTLVSFPFEKKYRISGYLNHDNLLERVEIRLDNPVLGDMLVESIYSDYKDFQHGLVFPSKIIQREGGYPVLDLVVNDAVRNAIAVVNEPQMYFYEGVGNPRFRGPLVGSPPPVSVDETLVAPGVHYLEFSNDVGEAYHSVVVEFNDYLVILEAPLDDAHSRAVIGELRANFGKKPIRYVVNTHAHFDAAGGLRTYAAEGATIITQEINKPYYDKVFALPRTITPDRLSETKKRALIEGVGDKRVLTDGTHVIELYHLQNGHSDGMLVAYLPREKIVVESDLYSARDPKVVINEKGEVSTLRKQPVSPYADDLVRGLDRLKVGYEQILCLLGRPARRTELLDEVKKSPTR
jgi:hypothetical protein